MLPCGMKRPLRCSYFLLQYRSQLDGKKRHRGMADVGFGLERPLRHFKLDSIPFATER